MKKILSLLLAFSMGISITACSTSESSNPIEGKWETSSMLRETPAEVLIFSSNGSMEYIHTDDDRRINGTWTQITENLHDPIMSDGELGAFEIDFNGVLKCTAFLHDTDEDGKADGLNFYTGDDDKLPSIFFRSKDE